MVHCFDSVAMTFRIVSPCTPSGMWSRVTETAYWLVAMRSTDTPWVLNGANTRDRNPEWPCRAQCERGWERGREG